MEWWGAVYICDECAVAIGRLYGMATPEDVVALRKEMDDSAEEFYELRRENSAMREVVRGFTALFAGDESGAASSSIMAGALADEGALEPTHSVGEGTGAPSESVHDKGMDVVHSDDRGHEPFKLGI